MANTCMFSMQAAGTHDHIEELLRRLNGKSSDDSNNLHRFENVCKGSDPVCVSVSGQEIEIAQLDGGCAWSVKGAGYFPDNGFIAISKELNLIIETYGEELGFEFQEHEIVAFGKIILDEEVDFCEYDVIDTIVSDKLQDLTETGKSRPAVLKQVYEKRKELYTEYRLKPIGDLIAEYNEISDTDITYDPGKMHWVDGRLIVDGFRNWDMMPTEEVVDFFRNRN